MIHNPIIIDNLELYFSHKVCFSDFNAIITAGQHIGIIGRNGSGKSTLLKILAQQVKPQGGEIKMPKDIIIGYVPQIIDDESDASGGEKFNLAFNKALLLQPDLLILDEPTNHLDTSNREVLFDKLSNFNGTVMVATHDIDFLRQFVKVIWDIGNEKINLFKGRYDDYIKQKNDRKSGIEKELFSLENERKNLHKALMKEQSRAKNSKIKGEKSIKGNKWPLMTSATKAGRNNVSGDQKKFEIKNKKLKIDNQLQDLNLPKQIIPKFLLDARVANLGTVVLISDGSIGYQEPLIENINFSIKGAQHIAITGKNGSGKSTFIKAILGYSNINKSGHWQIPHKEDIAHLDQHYSTLAPDQSVIDTVSYVAPHLESTELRSFLNSFLFRKHEEVNLHVKDLSGGEKARLSLACIAAKMPKLMILDEITNNLDLESRNNVIEILREYPGSLIVISHDHDFLRQINIEESYIIEDGQFFHKNNLDF